MPTTPNLLLTTAGHLGNIGAWDGDLNTCFTLLDSVWGGVSTVALGGVDVTLAANQWQVGTIILTGAVSANISVKLPAAGSRHTVVNRTTGNFVVRLASLGGGRVIGLPPQEYMDVVCDGSNVDFRTLGHRVGEYWFHGGTSVPSWVTACTVPPYLNCDGSGFSGVTYPQLATYLGGTTLPDAKGRAFFTLNQGSGRLTSGGSGGVDGDTLLATGGGQTVTLIRTDLPNVDLAPDASGTVPALNSSSGMSHTDIAGAFDIPFNQNFGGTKPVSFTHIYLNGNVGQTSLNNVPPAFIGGLVLIRAG